MYQVNGLKDIHTVLINERKLGGAVEAERIRLRTGEEFKNVVFTQIDMSGSIIYSVSFMTDEGKRYILNVNDISLISQAEHKMIKDLQNAYCKQWKTEEKIKYLNKLCGLNEGCCTTPFLCEAMQIIEDIGADLAKKHVNIEIHQDDKVVKLEKKVS